MTVLLHNVLTKTVHILNNTKMSIGWCTAWVYVVLYLPHQKHLTDDQRNRRFIEIPPCIFIHLQTRRMYAMNVQFFWELRGKVTSTLDPGQRVLICPLGRTTLRFGKARDTPKRLLSISVATERQTLLTTSVWNRKHAFAKTDAPIGYVSLMLVFSDASRGFEPLRTCDRGVRNSARNNLDVGAFDYKLLIGKELVLPSGNPTRRKRAHERNETWALSGGTRWRDEPVNLTDVEKSQQLLRSFVNQQTLVMRRTCHLPEKRIIICATLEESEAV